jgi:C4-type Zn-finger protein
MESKECPMCGEVMRVQTRNVTVRVPGTRESRTRVIREWICRECDYFEDVDES